LINRYDVTKVLPKLLSILASFCEDNIFDIDDENREALRLMALYICNDPSFEKESISDTLRTKPRLNAGVAIIGLPGAGKSILFKAIQRLQIDTMPLSIFDAKKIVEEFNTVGYQALLKFSHTQTYQSHKVRYCVINEMGSEPKVAKHFGNESNCIVDVISKQYDLYQDTGHKFFFTSNYNFKKLGEMYDITIESRLHHMCNVIYLGADSSCKDRRKS
jgi:DNA replication protein DnaC